MEIYTETMDDEIEEQYRHISNKIKELRISKKITQENMALAMGFTTATFYTNAENNRQGKHFNLEHIIKISKIMKIPLSNIFNS